MADNIDDLLIRWLDGEIPEDELRKTLPDEEIQKYKQIIHEVDQWTPDTNPHVFDVKEVLGKPKGRQISLWAPLSIAATVALLLVAGIWVANLMGKVAHQSKMGEVKEILLPDGKSSVLLASNSELSWQEDDWEKGQRFVSLEGKAFFRVEKGSAFRVTSENGTVEVLGTSFEVSEFDQSLYVACYTGKVRSVSSDNQSEIIPAGEGYLFHRGRWESKEILTGTEPSWIQSESRFTNAPLAQVIKTLEDEYDLEIITGKVNLDRRFSGSFPNDKLDQALQIVFGTLDISYELKGKKLYLSE